MIRRIRKELKKQVRVINFFPFNNRFKIKGTKVDLSNKTVIKCVFDCSGKGNIIEFRPGGTLRNCRFFIRGDNNHIVIGENSSATNGEFWIEDNDNRIVIGDRTNLTGKIQLACIEGCTISVGDDCLLSSEITIRTGDSHSILDCYGRRNNPSQDVSISRHVWIGHKVTINKGVSIGEDSVIGSNALVTKSIGETNVIIAGCPADIIKKNINWCAQRIEVCSDASV